MVGKTAVVYTCAHADPSVDNRRFDLLGKLIYDVRPDYVVDLGDGADMRSLNSYDTRYPQAIVAQSYERDINQYNDAMERVRHPFRLNKRKQPKWYGFEGNHEHRIKKALQENPRLEGSMYGVSFSHLNTRDHFDEYHEYENGGPAIAEYDGVTYAHFFTAGNTARPISGVHHAYGLVQDRAVSSTCGHSHRRSMFFKDNVSPNGIIGLVAGCFKGKEEGWAGQSNKYWWHGVVIKRNIEGGMYEPQFVSMEALERAYG